MLQTTFVKHKLSRIYLKLLSKKTNKQTKKKLSFFNRENPASLHNENLDKDNKHTENDFSKTQKLCFS